MAMLTNRDALSEDLQGKLMKLNRRQAIEFRELLGEPPEPKKVPESFWVRVAKEQRHEAAAALLFLLLLSYDNHRTWGEMTPPETTERRDKFASKWLERRLAKFERDWISASVDMFDRAGRAWEAKVRKGAIIPREQINELIRKIFGEARARTIALTESQLAMVDGGDAGVTHSGKKVTRYWGHLGSRPAGHCNAPVRPCKICSPREGKPQSEWRGEWPGRCHPNDDCFIVYVDEDDFVIGTDNGNLRPGNAPGKTWKYRS